MNELKIDWDQEKPSSSEMLGLWKLIQLKPMDNWSDAANNLIKKIAETHCNGGIQLHRYKLSANRNFDWFASRNRLDEINFVKNVLNHKDLEDYRIDLQVTDNLAKYKITSYSTDIYDLPGRLARILGQGGAYSKLDQLNAWKTSTEFIEKEFQNRFNEFNLFEFTIENADWFYDIAWDYSEMLFDKRNYEIILIDITDTD